MCLEVYEKKAKMPWELLEVKENEYEGFDSRFKRRCKFLVDESLGTEVAELLKEAGWNTKYVGEFGLEGQDDEKIFQTAYKEDRVLLTHDKDFLNDKIAPPNINPGIVVVLPGAQGKESELWNALVIVLDFIGRYREIYRGSKMIISEDFVITIISRNYQSGAMEKEKYKLIKKKVLIWED